MILKNYHTHTNFSDGNNTPEEMVRAAIDLGMTEIGFSDHSSIPFDQSYCIKTERIGDYVATIRSLQKKYSGTISILCGIEQDMYSGRYDDSLFDYAIGSLHYIDTGSEYITVDLSPECLSEAADKFFGGDGLRLAELYYESVSRVIDVTNADIIGHFDLISKFTELSDLIDVSDPRYVAAWQKAADILLKTGKPFEINTGAISRGYRTSPYPSADMIRYIKERGGSFILSSDSHSADTILFGFEQYENLL